MNYDIVHTNGHYEIYFNGQFYCSADTFDEAVKEVESLCTTT